MTGADIAICVIIIIGGWSGYKEGFLMELFSLLAIILGVLGAFTLMGWAMLYLADEFNIDKNILPYVAFGIVFIAIVIVVRLIGNMLKLSVDKSFLGRVDQIAGAVLGAFKTVFLLSVAIWLVGSLRVQIPDSWTNNSILMPYVAGFAPQVTSWIAEIFPVFKDVF